MDFRFSTVIIWKQKRMGQKLVVSIKILNLQSLNSVIPHLRVYLTEISLSICKEIFIRLHYCLLEQYREGKGDIF